MKGTNLVFEGFPAQINYWPHPRFLGQHTNEREAKFSLTQDFLCVSLHTRVMLDNSKYVKRRVYRGKLLEGIQAQAFDKWGTQQLPVVLSEIQYSISERGGLCHVERRLHPGL